MDRMKSIPGVVVGIVTNVEDPESMGRIKVTYPWLSGEPESAWCRLVSPMAGDKRGLLTLPEVGDEAVIAFNMGNFEQPYIVGFTWNKDTELPLDEVSQRGIQTLAENKIVLNDTEGEEGIEISDSHGNSIVMNKDGISITSEGEISITTSGNILIEAGSDLTAVGTPIELNP